MTSLDPRRVLLWHAMGLGPVWHQRGASQPAAVAEPEEASQAAPVLPTRGKSPVVEPVVALAPVAADERALAIGAMPWDALRESVAGCTACGLCKSRTQTVFGVGHQNARVLLVGEAPGAEEDARGEPFVGQAGKLLDNMLSAVGLTREGETAQSVYIANVLKCRPPGNRNPEPHEVAACEPYLLRQVALISPALIIVMGRFAAQSLLGTDASIASLRGRLHRKQVDGRDIPVVVTYHPAYLLRNLADKAKSWQDLCLAKATLDAAQ